MSSVIFTIILTKAVNLLVLWRLLFGDRRSQNLIPIILNSFGYDFSVFFF